MGNVERIKPVRMGLTDISRHLSEMGLPSYCVNFTARDDFLDRDIPAYTIHGSFGPLARAATEPEQQQAVAWGALETFRRVPPFFKSMRGQLKDAFDTASDIPQLHNASQVLETVCAVRPDFAHGPARALGAAVKGMDLWAPGYWGMVDTFSKVSAWSGQHELAAKDLSHILVCQQLSETQMALLHLGHHAHDIDALGAITDAFYQRSDQERQAGRTDAASSWEIRAQSLQMQLERLCEERYDAESNKAMKSGAVASPT